MESRETLRALLLGNVPLKKQAIIHLEPYLSHIEREVEQILQTFPAISKAANCDNSPPLGHLTTANASELLLHAMRMVFNKAHEEALTVNAMADSLAVKLEHGRPDLANVDLVIIYQQLAIAALGLATSLFSWEHSTSPDYCAINCGPTLVATRLHMDNCFRSVQVFISLLGLIPQAPEQQPRAENLLYLSRLNFHSLVHIGRLHVEWVPHLSQHLVLDLPSRTIRLFRYPSLCALALSGGDYQDMSRRIIHHHEHVPPASLHREVLLSLRFILGMTRKSRRLAKKLALPSLPRPQRDPLLHDLLEGNLDHLLDTRCAAEANNRKLSREDFLAPWNDFPLLGERLLHLQKYNDQQAPTRARNMIRDTRNPAQWYTLWALLLLGGLSVLLSIPQLGVAIAQLVLEARAQATATPFATS